ncbi:hypothetical protein AAMO2058_000568400 [Amorphochlora amoebiformis]
MSHRYVEGKLRIEVYKGRKLTDKKMLGTQSPYLVMKIGEKRLVTKIHKKGGLEPKWNQAFEFNITRETEQKIHIEVWSKETFSDTVIGKRSVDLYEFWKKTPAKGGWWRIHSKQYLHKIRGEVFFRIKVNGKTYLQTHRRNPSAVSVASGNAKPPPPPTEPLPHMIWQVALDQGVTVRTTPSLNGKMVTYDGKEPVVLKRGELIDSDRIHKASAKMKNGKYIVTYWIRHEQGWSCVKYGREQLLVPLCDFKIYEIIEKGGVSTRMAPGSHAKRNEKILQQGEVIIGRQAVSIEEQKGARKSWVMHDHGWSCAASTKTSYMAQIMFRKAFQVVLKQGVSVRAKPSLKAKILRGLRYMDVAVSREIKHVTEKNGQKSIWISTLDGWSCLKLDALVTMIPLGEGQGWWEVTEEVSIRTAPGLRANRTKPVLRKGDCLVSRGLVSVPTEHSYWVKLWGGYSCFKLASDSFMRLKSGVELWEVTYDNGLYIRSSPVSLINTNKKLHI